MTENIQPIGEVKESKNKSDLKMRLPNTEAESGFSKLKIMFCNFCSYSLNPIQKH